VFILNIRNWGRYQPKMKDRNVIWIKLYRQILEDYEWHNLSSDSKATLIEILLLASENNGELPEVHKIAFRLRKTNEFIQEQIELLSHWLQDVDKMLPSCEQDVPLEKSRDRVEKNDSLSLDLFDKFWKAYPNKTGRKDALKKWQSNGYYQEFDKIIKHIDTMKQTEQWKKGIIPNGSTYINQERWNDDPGAQKNRWEGGV